MVMSGCDGTLLNYGMNGEKTRDGRTAETRHSTHTASGTSDSDVGCQGCFERKNVRS